MSVQYILRAYSEFTKAQNLGVVFGPRDLSAELLTYFVVIREKLDEVIGGK